MIIEDYKPIDYRTWVFGDKAREGANIKRMKTLDSVDLEIWDKATPYQDQRNDPGQGELVTYFAARLTEILGGDRKITIRAAMLHDTGFYGGDPDSWIKLVAAGGDTESEARRRPHQNRGCMIAGMILKDTRHLLCKNDVEYFFEIADIIGDHDTRKLPTTLNGGIVRDADILWRFTAPCLKIYHPDKSCIGLKELLETEELNKEGKFHNRVSKEIARVEMVNTLSFLHPTESRQVLGAEYVHELELVTKSLYS